MKTEQNIDFYSVLEWYTQIDELVRCIVEANKNIENELDYKKEIIEQLAQHVGNEDYEQYTNLKYILFKHLHNLPTKEAINSSIALLVELATRLSDNTMKVIKVDKYWFDGTGNTSIAINYFIDYTLYLAASFEFEVEAFKNRQSRIELSKIIAANRNKSLIKEVETDAQLDLKICFLNDLGVIDQLNRMGFTNNQLSALIEYLTAKPISRNATNTYLSRIKNNGLMDKYVSELAKLRLVYKID